MEYFKNNPHKKHKQQFGYGFNVYRYQLEQQAQSRGIYDYSNDSDEYLTYRLLAIRLAECKNRLKQSKTKRAVTDSVKFMASITPQHVSGRLYKVENGDGCGTFCLWFIIIDAIIIFIFYLIHR